MYDFKKLHQQQEPLLLGNVWNVSSALAFQKNNFQALGTSSAAIANTLGYQDGEDMSFEELLYMVKRIVNRISIPLSVDIETGYAKDLQQLSEHIEQLCEYGVAGINIEDSNLNNGRQLCNISLFAKRIARIKETRSAMGANLFINVRTDTFLLNCPDKLKETMKRIKAFEAAGADGIFIPCIEDEHDIKTLVLYTELPINVMCMPNLPNFDVLKRLGVKRISMGDFLYNSNSKAIDLSIVKVQADQSFKSII